MARTLDDLHARLERLETLLRTAGLLPADAAAQPVPGPPPATRQDRLIAQSAANPLLALRTDIPSATTPEQSEPAPGAEPERMLGAGLPTPPAAPPALSDPVPDSAISDNAISDGEVPSGPAGDPPAVAATDMPPAPGDDGAAPLRPTAERPLAAAPTPPVRRPSTPVPSPFSIPPAAPRDSPPQPVAPGTPALQTDSPVLQAEETFSLGPPPPAPLRAERGAGPEPTLDASSGSPLSDGPERQLGAGLPTPPAAPSTPPPLPRRSAIQPPAPLASSPPAPPSPTPSQPPPQPRIVQPQTASPTPATAPTPPTPSSDDWVHPALFREGYPPLPSWMVPGADQPRPEPATLPTWTATLLPPVQIGEGPEPALAPELDGLPAQPAPALGAGFERPLGAGLPTPPATAPQPGSPIPPVSLPSEPVTSRVIWAVLDTPAPPLAPLSLSAFAGPWERPPDAPSSASDSAPAPPPPLGAGLQSELGAGLPTPPTSHAILPPLPKAIPDALVGTTPTRPEPISATMRGKSSGTVPVTGDGADRLAPEPPITFATQAQATAIPPSDSGPARHPAPDLRSVPTTSPASAAEATPQTSAPSQDSVRYVLSSDHFLTPEPRPAVRFTKTPSPPQPAAPPAQSQRPATPLQAAIRPELPPAVNPPAPAAAPLPFRQPDFTTVISSTPPPIPRAPDVPMPALQPGPDIASDDLLTTLATGRTLAAPAPASPAPPAPPAPIASQTPPAPPPDPNREYWSTFLNEQFASPLPPPPAPPAPPPAPPPTPPPPATTEPAPNPKPASDARGETLTFSADLFPPPPAMAASPKPAPALDAGFAPLGAGLPTPPAPRPDIPVPPAPAPAPRTDSERALDAAVGAGLPASPPRPADPVTVTLPARADWDQPAAPAAAPTLPPPAPPAPPAQPTRLPTPALESARPVQPVQPAAAARPLPAKPPIPSSRPGPPDRPERPPAAAPALDAGPAPLGEALPPASPPPPPPDATEVQPSDVYGQSSDGLLGHLLNRLRQSQLEALPTVPAEPSRTPAGTPAGAPDRAPVRRESPPVRRESPGPPRPAPPPGAPAGMAETQVSDVYVQPPGSPPAREPTPDEKYQAAMLRVQENARRDQQAREEQLAARGRYIPKSWFEFSGADDSRTGTPPVRGGVMILPPTPGAEEDADRKFAVEVRDTNKAIAHLLSRMADELQRVRLRVESIESDLESKQY